MKNEIKIYVENGEVGITVDGKTEIFNDEQIGILLLILSAKVTSSKEPEFLITSPNKGYLYSIRRLIGQKDNLLN